MRRIDNPNLNNAREKILLKGHANLRDIQAFIPCGNMAAKNIQQEIIMNIEKSGKKILTIGKQKLIKPIHLLNRIDLTEKQVHEYAEIERKKAANGN